MSKSKGSKKARLSAARLSAVQTVYQMRFGNHTALEASRDYLDNYAGMILEEEKLLEPDREMYSRIVQGVEARKDDLHDVLYKSLDSQFHLSETENKKMAVCNKEY